MWNLGYCLLNKGCPLYIVDCVTFCFSVPPLISNVKGTFEITDIRDLISITTGAVVTIPRGVSVRIKCIATGVPAPTITWYRRRPGMNKRYAVVPSAAVKIMYDYSLSISHAAVNDAAYYICVASNIAGRDEGSTVLNIGSKDVQFHIVLSLQFC